MNKLVASIDAINVTLARAIRWLALAMVLITVTIVILRYVFAIGAIPLQESVMYMHGMLFLFGIPYGVNKNTHVRVDILYARLNPRQQTTIDLVGHLIFLLPIAIFILITSWPYTVASWRVFEGSSEVGGLPAIFLLKTCIPITAVLLALQAVSAATKNIIILRGRAD